MKTIVQDNKVTVTVERTVRVGQTLRISASQGYLGILTGKIVVLDITTYRDIEDADNRSMAREFVRTYLDLMDMVDEPRLTEGLWVAYRYDEVDYMEGDILPLGEFLDHTSMW